MSKVPPTRRPRAPRRLQALGLAFVVGLLGSLAPLAAMAQEQPVCETGQDIDCVLPAWPETTEARLPSLFGAIDGTVWLEDASEDAPPGGLDILAVGIGDVTVRDAAAIRKSDALLRLGKVKKAVKDGSAVLVRIVLDRPIDQIADGYAGIHVATDIDGAASNDAPAAVGGSGDPFAGSQDVYSVTYATTTGKTRLFDSDLSGKWYKDRVPYAATWSAPNVLDLLVRPGEVGDWLKVVSYVDGAGYDSLTLGPNGIPLDGQVGLLPSCIAATIGAEPFVVARLEENGQTLRNVDAPASWFGGATLPIDANSRAALEALVSATDEDADGRIDLPSTASIFENGLIVRQRPAVQLVLDGEGVRLALQLGLTRRGYNVLRNVELKSTGDAVVDAYLERAMVALVKATPPFRYGKAAGPLGADSLATCLAGLAPAAVTTPAVVTTPVDGTGTDAGASSPSPSATAARA